MSDADSWILVADDAAIEGLLEAARGLGGRVTAVVVADREMAQTVAAAGPDQVRWFPTVEGVPAEAYAGQVAQAAAEAGPQVVLSAGGPASRVLLGAVAALLGAVVLTSVRDVARRADSLTVTCAAFGGIVEQSVETAGRVALVLDGGGVPAPAHNPAPITEAVDGAVLAPMRVVATRPAETARADLAGAQRVVAVGLGLKARDDLSLIQGLAAAANAEIACSLPVARDLGWLAEDRFVGISGQHIAPGLYIGVGISGQVQHMAGCHDASVIVAVNSDPDAPIFSQCDWGIVGDLYQVVPALTAALEGIRSDG